jgi:hypothetical protein
MKMRNRFFAGLEGLFHDAAFSMQLTTFPAVFGVEFDAEAFKVVFVAKTQWNAAGEMCRSRYRMDELS